MKLGAVVILRPSMAVLGLCISIICFYSLRAPTSQRLEGELVPDAAEGVLDGWLPVVGWTAAVGFVTGADGTAAGIGIGGTENREGAEADVGF